MTLFLKKIYKFHHFYKDFQCLAFNLITQINFKLMNKNQIIYLKCLVHLLHFLMIKNNQNLS